MSKLDTKLEGILKKDHRFIDSDGDLLKGEIIEKAWNIDNSLIQILLSDKDVKGRFFSEIDKHWVFNINLFVDFIQDKNFLNNSYTKFKNKIGLALNDELLNSRGDVSLVFPYKDCFLEGGQSDEESNRREVFFNEVLAQDEIDKLLDKKVLTNFKKYTAKGEKTLDCLNRAEDSSIKDNLIIKGNNLLAMHSLKEEFAGKVKLIYIDPPYNTGNDGFKYNDSFNHSTWLTFMKNRLEIAKELLSEDGAISIQCDDNEQAYLKVLLDEIFGRENMINTICVKMSHLSGVKMSHNNKKLPKLKEYILVYSKSFIDINPPKIIANWRDAISRYTQFLIRDKKNPEDVSKWKVIPLSQAFKDNGVNESDKQKFCIENCNNIFRTARNASSQFQSLKNKGFSRITTSTGLEKVAFNKEEVLFASSKVDSSNNFTESIGDIWTDIGINNLHKEGSVSLKEGKKPEKLIARIIDMLTKEGDIVLDYHLGSGTTAAVAHKMGRQYIGIEQMDYIEDIAVERLKKVIDGESGGISESVGWKGGGEFVYFELKKYNQQFVDDIQTAKSTKELEKIWEQMKDKSFLNWNVDLRKQQEAFDEWKELDLDKQKQTLISLLDKNQLYVNYSEIDDKEFKCTEEEKKLSKDFYKN